jgi:hypothetical protein
MSRAYLRNASSRSLESTGFEVYLLFNFAILESDGGKLPAAKEKSVTKESVRAGRGRKRK